MSVAFSINKDILIGSIYRIGILHLYTACYWWILDTLSWITNISIYERYVKINFPYMVEQEWTREHSDGINDK